VTAATAGALADGRALDKNGLHAELRERLRPGLLPWCEGCGSHHAAGRVWRYATIEAGARLDAGRRYLLHAPGPSDHPVRGYLRFYGPGTPAAFGEWAGVTGRHARRLWDEVAGDLAEAGDRSVLREDVAALESPPQARGVRLLPPGDPYLQKPNRPLLAPDAELRRRLFRPVGSPGVVLRDGRLAGVWRMARSELVVEPLGRLRRGDVEDEARRVAELRGAPETALVVA
jgi:hypothetical protein